MVVVVGNAVGDKYVTDLEKVLIDNHHEISSLHTPHGYTSSNKNCRTKKELRAFCYIIAVSNAIGLPGYEHF